MVKKQKTIHRQNKDKWTNIVWQILDYYYIELTHEFPARRSYLINSIKKYNNVLEIEAPKYDMKLFKKTGIWKKDPRGGSYANEVDEIGGKIIVGISPKGRGKYLYTGQHIGYVINDLVLAIDKWAQFHGYIVEGDIK